MSRNPDPEDAVREVVRDAVVQAGLPAVDWVLVFFTPAHIGHAAFLHEKIREHTGCKCIAGCSGLGVLSGAGEIFNRPGLAMMAGHTPGQQALAFAKYQELPDSAGVNQQLKETLEGSEISEPLFFFFPDVYQHQPYNFINTLNYVKTRPTVFGGGSCDDGGGRVSVQIGPSEVVVNGAGGLAFSGIPRFSAGVTQSCKTIGDPMFITEVRDDLVLSLDGVPALEVFARVASELEFKDLDTAARQLLISFPLDPEQPRFTGELSMVRHLTGIDAVNQGFSVSQIVHEGSVVSFAYRSPVTAREDLSEMLERLKTENPEVPSFGIYFNCAARGEALYRQADVDTGIIREQLGDFPLLGFFGGYEMARVPQGLQLYTYTGVLVLVYLEENT